MARRREEIELSLVDNLTRGLRGIEKGVSGLGASITKINQAAELAAKSLDLIGTAVSAVGGAVGGVADLELQLKRIAELSQASAEEQQAYYEAVTTAGDRFLTTASEAAEALRLLAEDGFKGEEAISALNTVLAFAQVNAQSAAQATTTLGTILDNFSEPASKIAVVADALTAVGREANVSTTALQEGLQRAAVAAEQAGLSVETTTALLGVLAKQGIEGGRAGQALATALQDLANPASTAGKALEKLGLDGDNFIEVLKRLQTDSAAAEKVLSGLGNRPRAAIQALLDQGGPALEEYIALVLRAGGASEEAGKAIGDSFTFQLSRLSNAIDKLKNDALTPILQPLADSADALADKLSELADRPEFEEFVNRVGDFAKQAADQLVALVESVEFDAVIAEASRFASETKVALETLAQAAGVAIQTLKLLLPALQLASDGTAKFVEFQLGVVRTVGNAFEKVSLLDDAYRLLAGRQEQAAESAKQVAQAIPLVAAAVDSIRQPNQQLIEEFRQVIEKLKGLELAVQTVTPSLTDYARAIYEAQQAGEPAEVKRLSDEMAALQQRLKQTSDAAFEAAGGLKGLEESIRAAVAAGRLDEAQQLAGEYKERAKQIDNVNQQVDKLIGRNKDAADSTSKLADSTNAANFEVKKTAEAAGDAGDKIKSMGEVMDGARSAAQAIAQRIQALRQEFSFSAGAAKLFETQLDNVNRQLLGSALSTSIGAYAAALDQAAGSVRRQIAAQAELADQLEDGLPVAALQQDAAATQTALEGMIAETESATGRFRLLSEQRLDRLRGEIRATISELRRQQDATAALIDLTQRLQDEADRRAGNDEAIAERAYQRELDRIAELEAQGDASSRRAAEEARKLAKANHEAELREIKERGREQRAQDDQTNTTRTQTRERERAERQRERDAEAAAGGGGGRGAAPQQITVNVEYAPQLGDLGSEQGLQQLARRLTPIFEDFRRRSL